MKKIMFNDKYGLTQSVLEGRKTMTRRVVNIHDADEVGIWDSPYITIYKDGRMLTDIMPTYKVGEEVAVAQSYKDAGIDFVPPKSWSNPTDKDPYWGNAKSMAGYTNKMFVRADLMPHHILITDIKVERLQEISEEDYLGEGIMIKSGFPRKKSFPYYFAGGKRGWDNSFSTPRKAFAALIDKVSGTGTWERNPWVFVYTFKIID